mmetsp:Transcript_44799/g.113435  ORF Transcript_44799/g.113435 Transcript_44799/m.113435 type:complete len:161 (+) Transcript_44799:814-1296(+)
MAEARMNVPGLKLLERSQMPLKNTNISVPQLGNPQCVVCQVHFLRVEVWETHKEFAACRMLVQSSKKLDSAPTSQNLAPASPGASEGATTGMVRVGTCLGEMLARALSAISPRTFVMHGATDSKTAFGVLGMRVCGYQKQLQVRGTSARHTQEVSETELA